MNILFILCDDLGWKSLSCYETPNLDMARIRLSSASCDTLDATRRVVLHETLVDFYTDIPYDRFNPHQNGAEKNNLHEAFPDL